MCDITCDIIRHNINLFSGVAVGSGCFNHVMSGIMASAISQGHFDDVIEEYRTINKVSIENYCC